MVLTRVILTTEVPRLKHLIWKSSVTMKQAEAWGEKHGYKFVWYVKRSHRVYGDMEDKNELLSEAPKDSMGPKD